MELQRMWLPTLLDAVVTGAIDVALTCGPVRERAGIATEVFCAEPLVVGLRPGHRLAPRQLVPFTLQWNPSRAHTMAVARFVHFALAADPPPGWHTQPDHLHHTEPDENPVGPRTGQQQD